MPLPVSVFHDFVLSCSSWNKNGKFERITIEGDFVRAAGGGGKTNRSGLPSGGAKSF
jgi:hypothetical protein